MSRFCVIKSAGKSRLARTPPTLAAAKRTYSGRSRSKNARVASRFVRSNSWRVRRRRFAYPSACNLRPIADPAKPPCPATKTRAAESINLLMVLPYPESTVAHQSISLGLLQIALHHLRNQFAKRDFRPPAKFLLRFGGIPQKRVHFCRTKVSLVDCHHAVSGFVVPFLVDPMPFPA